MFVFRIDHGYFHHVQQIVVAVHGGKLVQACKTLGNNYADFKRDVLISNVLL